MSDPEFPVGEDFFSLVSRVQDADVAAIDKRFAEQRAFEATARARTGEVTMNELVAKLNDDAEARLAALNQEITRLDNQAAEAAKREQERTNVGNEERFPAPVLTE